MTSEDDGIVVNLYNSGTAPRFIYPLFCSLRRLRHTRFSPSSNPALRSLAARPPKAHTIVTLKQETNYPLDGKITLTVTPDNTNSNGAKFPLRLRVPAWSKPLSLAVNGQSVRVEPASGANYITLTRAWKKGDRVELTLDMPTKLVLGDHENAGKAAVTVGPLVLALDSALNPNAPLNRLELATDNPTGFQAPACTHHTRAYPYPCLHRGRA